MTCGCGQSYVLNEPVDGITDARTRIKDTSFRSFTTFMLIALLVFTATFCLLFFINKKSQNNLETLNTSARNDPETTFKTITSQETIITSDEEDGASATTFPSTIKSISTKTCNTAHCRVQGLDILGRMDHSIDPCDDFSQFACGRAKDDDGNLYPETDEALLEALIYKNELATDNKHLRNFRDFFESCVRFDKESDYSKRKDQVLNSKIDGDNLTTLLAFLMLRQSTPLFEVRAGFISEMEGYGLQILPPGDYYDSAVLSDWSLESHIARHCFYAINKYQYEESVDLATLHEVHVKCRNHTFARKLREISWLAAATERELFENVDLEFLSQKIQVPSVDVHQALLNEDFSKTYVTSLKEKYGLIDWEAFFGKLIRDFDEDMPIYVYLENEYFEQMMTNLNDRMRGNGAKVLHSIQLYYQLQIYENFMAPNKEIEKFCMKQAMELMPQTAAILRSKHFDIKRALEHINSTFDALKSKFCLVIDSSNMDEQTKDGFKKDVRSLTVEFNENDYAPENETEVTLTDDYVSNLNLLLEEQRRTRMNTRENRATHEKGQFPIIVISHTKCIVINNDVVYKYWHLTKSPSYVSEAYLSFHLSRAIALYLDKSETSLGSQFYDHFQMTLRLALEKHDGERNWRGQKMRFNHGHEYWQKKVQISMSDRMADNLAIDVARRVIFPLNVTVENLPWISDDYDPEKQFFILIAQEYCDSPSLPELIQNFYDKPSIPGMFRINTMIANSDQFSVTFNCGQGSRMNPQEKTNFEKFVSTIDLSRFDVNK